MQVAASYDSTLARDTFVNTLTFNVGFDVLNPFSTDWNGLCSDLADIYDQHYYGGHPQIVVKAYNAEGVPPHYPIGEKILNVGVAPGSSGPREVAMCLSFYADRNIPRHRGRIYLPAAAGQMTLNSPRPNDGSIDKVLGLAQMFSDLGGTNVDWQVWSRSDNAFRKVTHAWVDDEWDTMRSRGMRPTTRHLHTIDE